MFASPPSCSSKPGVIDLSGCPIWLVHKMDWSNENILEFIGLLQVEPSIWNLKCKDHKKRVRVDDAWERIQNKFSVPCSIKELKKKRNILLTQYRDRLKRIKDSNKAARDQTESYRPTWFAFEAMHTYMGTVYNHRTIATTEEKDDRTSVRQQSEAKGSNSQIIERPLSCESDSRTSMDSNIDRSYSRRSNSPSGSDSYPCKRPRVMHDALSTSQFSEAFSTLRGQDRAASECDLYGQLIAEKLKPLQVEDRLVLMNEIDNLVFNYMMNLRQRDSSPRRLSVYVGGGEPARSPHTIHLPGPAHAPDDKGLVATILSRANTDSH